MLNADRPLARIWFALTAAVVVYAVWLQVSLAAVESDGYFTTPGSRAANAFVYFTILSNLLVGVTSAVMAVRPRHDGRLLRVARCDALLGITVTAIVYHAVLADLYNLQGDDALANDLLHTVTPIMMVFGWLMFGPRGWLERRVVVASLAYPLAYFVFTLVRGALIDWYPYPFLDVDQLGWGMVALNAVIITVLFIVVGLLDAGLDRLLRRLAVRGQAPRHSARIKA